jgi:hypothetical protein
VIGKLDKGKGAQVPFLPRLPRQELVKDEQLDKLLPGQLT